MRQYIGWCWDSGGSAWMNFSSLYVWAQYHALGFGYRAQTGIVVGGGGRHGAMPSATIGSA